MTFVIALVAVAVLLFIALSVWTRRERQNLGLDRGAVVAADDAQVTMPTLYSDRLGLIGRPDHILRCGNYLIPVEQKPNAGRAQRPTCCSSRRSASWCRKSSVCAHLMDCSC
jgi:hypothetical protein